MAAQKPHLKHSLLLASASPNRLQLLESIGLPPNKVQAADIDETPLPKENPRTYVQRVAAAKAAKLRETVHDHYILAADTIAEVGGRIIGKAATRSEAERILHLLSGRRHRVYSGVSVIAPDGRTSTRCILTRVTFCPIPEDELAFYLDSRAWVGKSGCYGIQSAGGGFVKEINGSYSNVIGLPLVETRNMLFGLGYRPSER